MENLMVISNSTLVEQHKTIDLAELIDILTGDNFL